MADGPQIRRGLHKGTLLGGASLFALATYWPEVFGVVPTVEDDFVSGIFQFIGGLTALAGVRETYRSWLMNEQRKVAAQPSGIFGAASFATLQECDATGLLDPHGLYLGLLDGYPLFYNGKAHLLTCAPARQGKGIGFVIPNLLHYQGAVVVTDPKGELAAVTAQHRAERFGQRVAVFNPWGLHGLPRQRINLLENIIALAADPALQRGLGDEVAAIVMQLYPEPEDTRNRFFREGARGIMRAVLLYLALHAPKRCNLPEMWRVIVQELAEVVRIYGPHTAKTIQSQAEVKQFFAVNSDELAQALARALGQRTIKTRSHNLGKLDTDDIGESLAEAGQPLMRAEEIVQMSPAQQILLVKGVRPILGERLPFWFIAPWRGWAAINPVEGDYPDAQPRVRLSYTEEKGHDDEEIQS